MVRDEADRRDEDFAHAHLVQAVELFEHIRPEPGLAGRARALEGERPALQTRPFRDETRGLEQLLAVGIALVEDPLGQRVRGEDHPRVGGAHAVGENVQEPGMVVPALDERDFRAAGDGSVEALSVLADREPRVMRREHQSDDPRRSTRQRRLDCLGDPRLPVLHPDEDRNAELPLQSRPLSLGEIVQRRAPADPSVALGQVLDRLVRDRAAAAHVLEVRPHVLRT